VLAAKKSSPNAKRALGNVKGQKGCSFEKNFGADKSSCRGNRSVLKKDSRFEGEKRNGNSKPGPEQHQRKNREKINEKLRGKKFTKRGARLPIGFCRVSPKKKKIAQGKKRHVPNVFLLVKD